ncbi:hypothetical protein P20480_2764 [Pseudoalteromonas sp. BSi20480]|nr:hypothetical protein [Pseudoalteromonas sp. BSi20480]GAA76291.1 hypothetical protein P20480_2764 [Pseudoalteromonas sp. BSi20480]
MAAELFDKGANKYRRLFAAVGLLLAISGVIATQSRGGLLGIAAILSFFLYQKVKNTFSSRAVCSCCHASNDGVCRYW